MKILFVAVTFNIIVDRFCDGVKGGKTFIESIGDTNTECEANTPVFPLDGMILFTPNEPIIETKNIDVFIHTNEVNAKCEDIGVSVYSTGRNDRKICNLDSFINRNCTFNCQLQNNEQIMIRSYSSILKFCEIQLFSQLTTINVCF